MPRPCWSRRQDTRGLAALVRLVLGVRITVGALSRMVPWLRAVPCAWAVSRPCVAMPALLGCIRDSQRFDWLLLGHLPLRTYQMHQLLVEFEKDSARMKFEEARKRERSRRASALGAEEIPGGEGRGRSRGTKPEKDASGHGGDGPKLISVGTGTMQKTLPSSPAPEESPAGSDAVQKRKAERKACAESSSVRARLARLV